MEYKIITICGSMRFSDKIMEMQRKLSLQGNIILLPIMHEHHYFEEENKYNQEYLDRLLIEMHNTKIDMSDEVFVINVDGYIGDSTRREIEYAKSKNKKISYLE